MQQSTIERKPPVASHNHYRNDTADNKFWTVPRKFQNYTWHNKNFPRIYNAVYRDISLIDLDNRPRSHPGGSPGNYSGSNRDVPLVK